MAQYNGNIAILGTGNIGSSLAKGLVKSSFVEPGQISLTRRNVSGLQSYADQGFLIGADNAAAVAGADIVVQTSAINLSLDCRWYALCPIPRSRLGNR
jgi:pyrroline-5-carboxylate reductase